ncbi:pentatricopeptide repeat-containing protein [Tanacetum coccineum]
MFLDHNTTKAQELFDEIRDRNLVPDSGIYNALINAYIRSGNVMSATRVMNKMEENNIVPDHVTLHTMFSGLINSSGDNSVLPLYHQMIGKHFVPKTPIVVMLMTLFCKNREVNEALGFWRLSNAVYRFLKRFQCILLYQTCLESLDPDALPFCVVRGKHVCEVEQEVGGMHAAAGFLTARDGMTSHAAAVAWGWGKYCVSGCADIHGNDDMKVMSKNGYDGAAAIDIWSCRVILYVLLVEYLPFEESNLASLYKRVHRFKPLIHAYHHRR